MVVCYSLHCFRIRARPLVLLDLQLSTRVANALLGDRECGLAERQHRRIDNLHHLVAPAPVAEVQARLHAMRKDVAAHRLYM